MAWRGSARRAHRKAAVLGTILLVLTLAGCSEAPPPVATGLADPPAGWVEAADGLYVAENRGLVRGSVVNDAGLAVSGARVSLVATESFDDTDATGAFLLRNVTVQEHTLRVEARGFQVHEETIQVTRVNVTDVEIVLLPDASRGAGYRPHVHDYWGERTEHVLLDGPVDLKAHDTTTTDVHPMAGQVTAWTYYSNADTNEFIIPIPITEPEPNLVYPGAKEIQVTVRWTQNECTLSQLGLKYVSAAASDEIVLDKRASGEPFVIPVTQEMTDNGHQTFTLWEFYINPGNDVRYSDYEPGFCQGPIDVVIKAIKGSDPPLEPPHPDFWKGEDRIVLLDDAVVSHTALLSRPAFRLGKDQLVPPGTERMRMELWWSYQQANGTSPSLDHVLTWRTANQYPVDTPYSEYERAEPVASGPQSVAYEIEVAPGQTDAFYQQRSVWEWLPSLDGYEDDNSQPDTRPREFHLTVSIFRNAGFDASR